MDERVDHEALAGAARKCAVLRRAEAVATWVGAGRPVTAKGVVRRADLPDVGRALGIDVPPRIRSTADVPDLHTPWIAAVSSGLVSIRGRRVRPGPALTRWRSITDEELLDLWLRGLAACLQTTFPDDGDGVESLEVGRVVLTALTADRARTGADLIGAIDRMITDSPVSFYQTFDQDLGFGASVQVALKLLVAFGAAAPRSRSHRITPLGHFALSTISARGQLQLRTSDSDDVVEGICQLKITLRHVQPACWRRVHVSASASLGDLHEIIQIAFAWDDDHLHGYMVGRHSYGDPGLDFERDESAATLATVLTRARPTVSYTYDFGDSWLHEIKLEKTIEVDSRATYPVCVDGRGDAPVEDWCEGEPEWVPFDRVEINDQLARLGSSDHRAQSQLHDDIGVILTDAYGEAEEMTAFYTVLDEEISFPVPATLLGNPVTVTGLDEDDAMYALRARCKGEHGRAAVSFADLEFRPATVEAWLQAAYLTHLGRRPPVVTQPTGWDGLSRWIT